MLAVVTASKGGDHQIWLSDTGGVPKLIPRSADSLNGDKYL